MKYKELIDYCNMDRYDCIDCPYNHKECDQFVKETGYSPWNYTDNNEDFLNREVKENETEFHSLTAEDVHKFAEDLWKNRMIDEKTEIKDKLLNIFQKHYCMICASQCLGGDLRDRCSYYRSYIDKIKEAYDDMKGEIE